MFLNVLPAFLIPQTAATGAARIAHPGARNSFRKESLIASDKAAASSKLYHSQTKAPSISTGRRSCGSLAWT